MLSKLLVRVSGEDTFTRMSVDSEHFRGGVLLLVRAKLYLVSLRLVGQSAMLFWQKVVTVAVTVERSRD
jgi:hypothetical protein